MFVSTIDTVPNLWTCVDVCVALRNLKKRNCRFFGEAIECVVVCVAAKKQPYKAVCIIQLLLYIRFKNVDAAQSTVRSIMYHTSRRHWQRSRLIMGSTPTPFATMYKPGGTMVLSTGNITGRVIASDMDPWGRWTSQTYRGLNQMRITIISAYQVGQDDPKKGAVTAATQQRSLLLLANDPVSDPRTAFKRDLSSYIQACKSKGDELIHVGDFNEKLGRSANGIEKRKKNEI